MEYFFFCSVCTGARKAGLKNMQATTFFASKLSTNKNGRIWEKIALKN